MALSRLLRPMHTSITTMSCIAEIDAQSANTLAGKSTDASILDRDVGLSGEIRRHRDKDDFYKQACDASGHLYRRFYHQPSKQEHQ